MKIKKVILVILMTFLLVGCTTLKSSSCDDILNNFTLKAKPANVFRKGYKFYVPKGTSLKDAGTNYAIIESNKIKYYIYFDLVTLNEEKSFSYEVHNVAYYQKEIINNDKRGYVEINLMENNQYLIEIVYNYAKIEVMVDNEQIKEALLSAVAILNSINYDKNVIANLLENSNSSYKEEVYDMFGQVKNSSDILNFSNDEDEIEEIDDKIIDTDFIN